MNLISTTHAPSELNRRHKRALLLVTFGSTYPGPHQTFAKIRDFFAQTFPNRDIFMAFTSGMCMKRWYEKSGEQYYPADQWLDAIGRAGYESVSVQSLHIIPGLEYSFIHDKYLPAFKEKYPHIPICSGTPLLYSPEDIATVGDIIYSAFAQRLKGGEALVLMGHGNGTAQYLEANRRYSALNSYLQDRDPKIVIGTVDYSDMLYEQVSGYLHANAPAPRAVNFLPLMSVAGDHALNDMVGEWEEGKPLQEQSWRERLLEEGYISHREEHCHLHGLGDYDQICRVWADHLIQAEEGLNSPAE